MMQQSGRGTGKTLEMVKALPDGALVVTHNVAVRAYVRRMITDVRGKAFAERCRIEVIRTREDARRVLAGRDGPVAFDHAWSELTPTSVVTEASDLAAAYASRS